MAESISEGTLKAWSKKEGDTVAADEEVATIETDKVSLSANVSEERPDFMTLPQIDVSVNAPQAGKIVKFLANEEDTVAVGQDLFILEPGDFGGEGTYPSPSASNQLNIHLLAPSESSSQLPQEEFKSSEKDVAEPADQQTNKSLPEPPKPSANDKKAKPASSPKPKDEKTAKKEEKKDVTPSASAPPGSRNETRVSLTLTTDLLNGFANLQKGENEPHASTHRRTSQTISERRGFTNDFQRNRHVLSHLPPKETQGRRPVRPWRQIGIHVLLRSSFRSCTERDSHGECKH